MKPFLPLGILFFAFANTGISQITIGQNDMPQPGDTVRLTTTTDTVGLPTPALTGAGITWDYSSLVPHSQTIDTFLTVSSTPVAYQLYFNDSFLYPLYKSTVAQSGANVPSNRYLTVDDVINYYKDESSNYEGVGYGANINSVPTSVKDDTIDVVYKFPMNYGNKDSCHSSSNTNVPTIGYFGEFQYRINHVEGWGTLITPYGTFQTLKVETILYSSDSLYITALSFGLKIPQPEQIQYKWLATGEALPVLQINETVTGSHATYVNTVYRDSARSGLLGIAGINSPLNNIAVYPNPAAETTLLSYYLSNTSLVNITVYAIDGRCVGKIFNGEQSGGNHNLTMNVSNLPQGIYFIKVEANGAQAVKKLAVVK